jgi:hypothetical protein
MVARVVLPRLLAMFEAFSDGEFLGESKTLRGCRKLIERSYRSLHDRYEGRIHWGVFDTARGFMVDQVMPGAIWDACCEESVSFEIYCGLQKWAWVCGDPARRTDGVSLSLGYGSE